MRLQSFHTGIERCLVLINRVLNGGTPEGSDWHRRLLERMGQATSEGPVVLSAASIEAVTDAAAARIPAVSQVSTSPGAGASGERCATRTRIVPAGGTSGATSGAKASRLAGWLFICLSATRLALSASKGGRPAMAWKSVPPKL
jgi:hypothetical protein